MDKKNLRQKGTKGITLIALVITIIVMLILVAVTISMAINGGLFEYAGKAVSDTQNEINKEQQLANGKVEIDGEWYNSIDEYLSKDKVETIPTTTSYVGCYADFDGNGVPEGIIYADLAHTVSGRWNNDNWSDYSYTAESGFKSYYIKEENYTEGVFDNNDENEEIAMIAPVEGATGKDRFYVMALEDINVTIDETDYSTFYWYYNANGKLDRPVATDYNDFGEGKSNTIDMLNDWNNNTATYGGQDTRDLWGVIQEDEIKEKYPLVTSETDSQKWFVPSKAEWAAFGDYLYTKLGVTTGTYGNYGLSSYYWSSSQFSTKSAYSTHFDEEYIIYSTVYRSNYYVRLSATF